MIDTILRLFIYLIIVDIILSYVPNARYRTWAQKIHKIADYPQKPIRKMLPQNAPFDPSPMIVIIIIEILIFIF
jgi:YggT family protein